MKSHLNEFSELCYDELLFINGGYSGSSGGGGGTTSNNSSRSSSSRGGSSSSSSSSYSGSYSSSSGASGTGKGSKASYLTSYSASSSFYNYNQPRFVCKDGVAYSSVSGYVTYTNYDDRKLSGCNNPESSDKPTTTVFNQHDFDSNYGTTFGKTFCAGTSLANEVAQLYKSETGKDVSKAQIQTAIDSAIKNGSIGKSDGFVNNWETAATTMINSLGMKGTVTYSNKANANTQMVIYGVNYDRDQFNDHFVSTVNEGTYYDVQNGKTGYVSDLNNHGWQVNTIALTYKK